ncbi:MAG: hypothetical protein ACI9V8_001008 [Urechidicola sp.]|jgi:hypothetical protein
MKINIAIVLLLSLLTSACSFTSVVDPDARPDWVNGQSKKYASSLYLSGQGSALTLGDAKDRARSDLAKQFEVGLKESGQQTQTFTSEQANGEMLKSLNQKISRQLFTYTSRTLKGVEIAEQWYDPKQDTHYALAVLSRNKTRQRLEQELKTLDQRSQQRLLQAEVEPALLTRAALVQLAINTQQQRIVVQSSLQVVDLGGFGKPANLALAELVRSRDALLKKVRISPMASGDMSNELAKVVSGAAAGAGFSINNNTFDYQLKIQTLLDPVLKKNGWFWLRGTMEINLIDTAGNNIGVQRWPLKVSSIDIKRTQQRLLSEADNLLKEELRDVLLGFAAKP